MSFFNENFYEESTNINSFECQCGYNVVVCKGA